MVSTSYNFALNKIIEHAYRYGKTDGILRKLDHLYTDNGTVTEITKQMFELDYSASKKYPSKIYPGDVVILYRDGSSIKIPITALIDHAIIEYNTTGFESEKGHMIWSLLLKVEENEHADSVLCYMQHIDPDTDKRISWIMGVWHKHYIHMYFKPSYKKH